MKCKSCGAGLDLTMGSCPACGAQVELVRLTGILGIVCRACDAYNEPGAKNCAACGEPMDEGAEASPPTRESGALEPGRSGVRPATTEALCLTCGATLRPELRFCAACGKAVRSSPAVPLRGAPAAVTPPAPGVASGPVRGGAGGPAAVPPPPPADRIRLALLRSDGRAGPAFSFEREAICGRTEGDVRLAADPSVSPRHARFTLADGVVRVEDLRSVNGTFLRVRGPRPLAIGDEIRMGRQHLRLESLPRPPVEGSALPWGTRDPGYGLRLAQLLEDGRRGEIFPLREGDNAIGREAGEVTFPSDRYVSARHARIAVAGDAATLTDAGSSNGTYVRIASAELAPGDQLLIGSQLLQVG